MFTSIKTSKYNKEVVTQLTRRLNLGAENVIARIAFAYSLARDRKMDLTTIQDAQGKEYSTKVLFGEYTDFYVALICVHYNLYKTDKDIARYVKMHIDDGLELIDQEVAKKSTLTGDEFLINAIEKGLKHLA
ncbi:DndE family protein [Paraflavitalea speifideaquila]|uniref:DndE family protein n=1 Tax=Paraflavitalea speifideaquila TaxID=3076558 RepID=UPI0028E46628|nr:DndE family protein [Paraflavitalea speifideiaquila]